MRTIATAAAACATAEARTARTAHADPAESDAVGAAGATRPIEYARGAIPRKEQQYHMCATRAGRDK
eukprot:13285702-Alexandrium_andersonii.AAC.1